MVYQEPTSCTPEDRACRDPRHANGQNLVYRIRGKYGDLLYVGITRNFHYRMRAHAKVQPWWRELESVEWFTYPDRVSALWAEARAIDTENPRYNVARTVPFVDLVVAAHADPRYQQLREMID